MLWWTLIEVSTSSITLIKKSNPLTSSNPAEEEDLSNANLFLFCWCRTIVFYWRWLFTPIVDVRVTALGTTNILQVIAIRIQHENKIRQRLNFLLLYCVQLRTLLTSNLHSKFLDEKYCYRSLQRTMCRGRNILGLAYDRSYSMLESCFRANLMKIV